MLKRAAYSCNDTISLLTIIVLLFCFATNSHAAKNSDRSSANAIKSGINYLLPIGFQMATIIKSDTGTCHEKDSLTCKKVAAKKRIYRVDINPDFSHSTIRKTEEAFKQAELYDADYILIHMYADDPDAGNTTSFIQSKFRNKSKPVFFYVDSKINSNRSLLAITQGDSTNGKFDSKALNIHQYQFNSSSNHHNKNKITRLFTDAFVTQSINPTLTTADYAATGSLVADILYNNNLSNFEVVQYNPGKYGKLIDLLTQRWVCFILAALLTWLIAMQLKIREAGPHSFIILCLLLVLLGALYEERLATINEVALFLSGIAFIHIKLFKSKKLNWDIFTCTGTLIAITGLALALTSYNTDFLLFLSQLSLTVLCISSIVLTTLKLYLLFSPPHIQNFNTPKSLKVKRFISQV